MPKMMKKAQQIKTILPMGFRDVMSVSTTSFSPGALLITLEGRGGAGWGGGGDGKNANRLSKIQIKQLSSQPEGAQRPEQPENTQDSQDLGPARHGHHDIDEGHKDEEPVQDVPAAPQVSLLPQVEAHRHNLEVRRHTHEFSEGERGSPAELPAVCNDKSTELKRSERLWMAQLSGFHADAEFCRLCCDGGKILSLQKKKNSKEIPPTLNGTLVLTLLSATSHEILLNQTHSQVCLSHRAHARDVRAKSRRQRRPLVGRKEIPTQATLVSLKVSGWIFQHFRGSLGSSSEPTPRR